MNSTKLTVLGILAFLVMPACVKKPYVAEHWEPIGPCDRHLEDVQHATFGDQAEVAVRLYLDCLISQDVRPPIDLEDRVSDRLRRNPYPATSRDRDDVLAHFFDKDGMKALPGSVPGMHAYVQLLEDQALAARAAGDEKLALAAETRATKVKKLLPVLEDIEG